MEIRYYRDPETGAPHIHDHGVTVAEAERILAFPGEDEPCSGVRAKHSGRPPKGDTCVSYTFRTTMATGFLW